MVRFKLGKVLIDNQFAIGKLSSPAADMVSGKIPFDPFLVVTVRIQILILFLDQIIPGKDLNHEKTATSEPLRRILFEHILQPLLSSRSMIKEGGELNGAASAHLSGQLPRRRTYREFSNRNGLKPPEFHRFEEILRL